MLVWILTDCAAGQPVTNAVMVEALTGGGQRTEPRWRRNYGSVKGRAVQLGDPEPLALAVVEGPADALALAWLRLPGLMIRAATSTAGFGWAAAGWGGPVVVIGDGGRAGRDAARLKQDWHEFEAQLKPAAEADPAAVFQARFEQALEILGEPPELESDTDRQAREKAALPKLRQAFFPPLLAPASDWADHPIPDPVLWRDAPDADQWPQPMLSVGEAAVLSGEGGLGKSYLTLALAGAAGSPDGAACGLRVRQGPVVLVSYEDAPGRIAHRLKTMTGESVPHHIHVWDDPHPLWQADPEEHGKSRPCGDWDRLWDQVREIDASLIVIDPASAALADVDVSQTGPVRQFLRALTREAGTTECGVLIVAHSTKAARNAQRRGEDPGAGVVAGSAAWFDGARGVLSLARGPWTEAGDDRLLKCVKSNYGRTGWGARLREDERDGRFAGLVCVQRYDRDALAQERGDQKAKRPAKGGMRAAAPSSAATLAE